MNSIETRPIGRPSIYTNKVVTKVKEYLKECQDSYEEFHKTRGEKSDSYERIKRVKYPSMEGLALYLKINSDTLFEWAKKYPEFSEVIRQLKDEQVKRLMNGGLSGEYSPVVTKLLLSKLGYRESQDMNVNVNQITGFNFLPPETIDVEFREIDENESQDLKQETTENEE